MIVLRAALWLALLAVVMLWASGCAALGYSEVGIYFQHGTDVNKSFALQWMRDEGKGKGYKFPDCSAPPVVGVPTWHCPAAAPCDGETCNN